MRKVKHPLGRGLDPDIIPERRKVSPHELDLAPTSHSLSIERKSRRRKREKKKKDSLKPSRSSPVNTKREIEDNWTKSQKLAIREALEMSQRTYT